MCDFSVRQTGVLYLVLVLGAPAYRAAELEREASGALALVGDVVVSRLPGPLPLLHHHSSLT